MFSFSSADMQIPCNNFKEVLRTYQAQKQVTHKLCLPFLHSTTAKIVEEKNEIKKTSKIFLRVLLNLFF